MRKVRTLKLLSSKMLILSVIFGKLIALDNIVQDIDGTRVLPHHYFHITKKFWEWLLKTVDRPASFVPFLIFATELVRDYERLPETSEALRYLAMIRIMIRCLT
ncbi:MAG: hypothetical protein JO235_12900 [Chroococcidiopsidaceae cyanobacterium CP_BM_RX_35]|nr:hypothetical protein [Chroococcidiopsidaceae cyanobacterium CP_BM_RX_35]